MSEEDKLEVVQMRMLRSILRLPYRDQEERPSNDSIRQTAGVQTIRDRLSQRRLGLFRRVMRMTEDRWPRAVLCGSIVGGRGAGRARGGQSTRWSDKVLADLKSAGARDPGLAVAVVTDPGRWKEIRACFDRVGREGGGREELRCGGRGCTFVVCSKSQLKAHREGCSNWIESIHEGCGGEGFRCIRGCPMVAKSTGGLKNHQRACKIFRAQQGH